MLARRITSILLALFIVLSMSGTVFAAEIDAEGDGVTPRSTSTSASFYVTDNSGNKFFIYGYCYTISKKAASYTGFEVTDYADDSSTGQAALNNAAKSISAGGSFTLHNSVINTGSYSYGGTLTSLTGSKNSTVSVSGEYASILEYIDSIVGYHRFKYNGSDQTKSSMYYYE